MYQPVSRRDHVLSTIGIVALAGGVFAVDVLTPLEVSVSILYVFAVLVASLAYGWTGIVLVGVACEVLTLGAHALSPCDPWAQWPLFDRAIGVVGIAMSTLLVLRNQTAMDALQRSEAYLAEA